MRSNFTPSLVYRLTNTVAAVTIESMGVTPSCLMSGSQGCTMHTACVSYSFTMKGHNTNIWYEYNVYYGSNSSSCLVSKTACDRQSSY